jgi:hypothetical protein
VRPSWRAAAATATATILAFALLAPAIADAGANAPHFTERPHFVPRRFVPVHGFPWSARPTRRHRRGTRLELALSKPATVIATLEQVAEGRQLDRGKVRWETHAGPARLRWSGKIAGFELPPGRYVAYVRAMDSEARFSPGLATASKSSGRLTVTPAESPLFGLGSWFGLCALVLIPNLK